VAEALVVLEPGRPALAPYDPGPVPDGGFLVDIAWSGVSAGTEVTWVRGTNPALHAGLDPELGVFVAGRPSARYPVERLGYMESGRVAEARTDAVAEGDRVALACGHRTAYVVQPRRERFVVLPRELDPLLGVLVAHMGPICANGVLHAAAEHGGGDALGDGVRDRCVLVCGAGVVGLLTALFARRGGAAEVAVADTLPERLAAARALGLLAVDEREAPAWAVVKERWRHGPRDVGADLAFQCRGRAEALAGALRALRPQGTVIDLAFYQGGAEALRLGEEFHHNGLGVRCAQIGRVPRALADRWDRDRLSAETIALLREEGAAIREHLVSDVVPLAEGPALLAALAERRRRVLLAVLACAPGLTPR
jgi:threonine dehydrogenase-like Zn-dependent dehydrogenase